MNILAPTLLVLMTTLPAPAATRLTANRVERIDALFAEYETTNAPGLSVMIVRDGRPVFAKGYGLADLETRVPCTTNTNFRLASVTKQFTAMAILMLVEREKLSLSDRLTNFFPEFPEYGRDISVRHLLTHTSGLPDYEGLIPPGTTLPVLDRDVLRLLLKQDKTYFQPGSEFRYSNSGYAMLALIVEIESGQTFARFLKDNIFTPLRMTRTVAYEPGSSIVFHRAYGHSPDGDGFKRTDQSLTSSVLGDGGVYSSVADLLKWDQALYGTNLVSQRLVNMAFTSATTTDKRDRTYGFGWYLGSHYGMKEVWHGGETVGFRTRIARFPEQKLTIILLANRSDIVLDELPHKIVEIIMVGSK